MVISNTSAVDASIHAVSPELIFAPSMSSGFVGAAGAAAAGAAAAGFASSFFASVAALSCASVAPAKASDSTSARNAHSLFIVFSSERSRIGLAGADADYLLKIEHEDLAVADLAGVRRFLDRVDRLLEHLGFDGRLDLYLRQEVDHVLRASIELGVPLLPTE